MSGEHTEAQAGVAEVKAEVPQAHVTALTSSAHPGSSSKHSRSPEQRTKPGSESLEARTARRIHRTLELDAEGGHTNADIAAIIAREEGSDEPLSRKSVQRWRSAGARLVTR